VKNIITPVEIVTKTKTQSETVPQTSAEKGPKLFTFRNIA